MRTSIKSCTINSISLVILGGSLWGFSEVTLNSAIRTTELPFRAAILTGIAFLIMGFIAGRIKKAQHIIPVVIPAVLIIQMGVLVCGNSIMCRANSSIALMLHTAMISTVIYTAGKKPENLTWLKAAFFGSTAALASSIAFYFTGMRCAPCPYLLSFNSAAGFLSYLVSESIPWSILGGAGFASGYYFSKRIASSENHLMGKTRIAQYVTGISVVLACWIVSAVIIIG